MILTHITPTNLVKGKKCAQRFKHIVTACDWRHKTYVPVPTVYEHKDKRKGPRLAREPPLDKPPNLLRETYPTVNSPVSETSSQPNCAGPPWVTGSALQVTASRCDCFQNQFRDSSSSLLGSALAHMHTCAKNSVLLFHGAHTGNPNVQQHKTAGLLTWPSHRAGSEAGTRSVQSPGESPAPHGRALPTGASAAALRHRCRYEGTLRMACPRGTQEEEHASAFRDLGGDEAGGSQCAVTFHTVTSVLRYS